MLSEQVDQRLQTLHPDIHAHLGAIIDLAPSATDPLLLNLCSSYIDAALSSLNLSVKVGGLVVKLCSGSGESDPRRLNLERQVLQWWGISRHFAMIETQLDAFS